VRVLLDTQAFLWWVAADPRLPRKSRDVIRAPANDCLLSMASVWEMAIKSAIGKLRLDRPVRPFVRHHVSVNEFELLDIGLAHLGKLGDLPFHHRDPFDRLIAAQALVEDLALVSSDRTFARYGLRRIF